MARPLWLGPVQTQVLNPLLMRNITYDPLKDFVGIGTVAAPPQCAGRESNTLNVNLRAETDCARQARA